MKYLTLFDRATVMNYISLTDFVDIVASAGGPKATKVADIKKRGEYEHYKDFWKILREHIIRMHRKKLPLSHIDESKKGLTDKNKINNYPTLISGYKKWLGKKSPTWFKPPSSSIAAFGIEVSINPELGLKFGKKKHIIKLYFKKDPKLSLTRAHIANAAMEKALRPFCNEDDVIAVLDIREAKLYKSKKLSAKDDALIAAELSYIDTLWSSL